MFLYSAVLLCMPQTWILKGRRAEDEMYRSMWERAMDDMITHLVVKNNASGLTYVASISPCALFCQLSAASPLPFITSCPVQL